MLIKHGLVEARVGLLFNLTGFESLSGFVLFFKPIMG
jgi:hypothetical protein